MYCTNNTGLNLYPSPFPGTVWYYLPRFPMSVPFGPTFEPLIVNQPLPQDESLRLPVPSQLDIDAVETGRVPLSRPRRIKANRTQKNFKFEEQNIKSQNSQRNLLSNILHHMINFVHKSHHFEQIMQRIIKTHGLNVCPAEVIRFVSSIKLRTYIKVNTVQDLWSKLNPNQELSKAFRIFSYYFFKEKSYPFICHSKRIKSGTKIQHSVKIRHLIGLLLQS